MFEFEVFISEFFAIDAIQKRKEKFESQLEKFCLPFTTSTITDKMKKKIY
jgi:hypothetical protein